MVFGGLQKLTLLDYPDKTACTLFTAGCNFRCPYCHNAALVLPERAGPPLEGEAVLDFLRTRQGLLDGVCVSGGEPLLHRELPGFLRAVKALGFLVKLDTNGSRPEALKALVAENLVDYVAMDVKNAPKRYAETAGVPGLALAPVEGSVAFLLSGVVDYEFRTTVVRELHSEKDLSALAGWLRGAKRYYLQGYEDSGDLLQRGFTGYQPEEMRRLLGIVRRALPCAETRGL